MNITNLLKYRGPRSRNSTAPQQALQIDDSKKWWAYKNFLKFTLDL